MKTEFYKMEYESWDEGTDGLTLEVEAAYLRLCHQMYRRRGSIPNEIRTLKRLWRCGHNKAVKLLNALIKTGKIHVGEDGVLSQSRVSQELVDRGLRLSQAAVSGKLGGSQRAVNEKISKENNIHTQADASSTFKPSQATRLDKTREEKKEAPASADAALTSDCVKKEKAKRATRLDANWTFPKEWLVAAQSEGFTLYEAEREAKKFKDYWLGTGGAKVDWHATWRNWARKGAEYSGKSPVAKAAANKKYNAKFGTPQLDAWDAYWLKTKGKLPPRDKGGGGGWFFETEWPPDTPLVAPVPPPTKP